MSYQTIDFEELEAKTSLKLVEMIKKDMTSPNNKSRVLHGFEINNFEFLSNEYVVIYMIAGTDCYEYFFHRNSEYILRQCMSIFTIEKFMKMYQEKERMDEIGD